MVWLVFSYGLFFFVMSTLSCSSTYKKMSGKLRHAGVLRTSGHYRLNTMSGKIKALKKSLTGNRNQQNKQIKKWSISNSVRLFLFFKLSLVRSSGEPLEHRSVTTSSVLHCSCWLQLLVTFLLQTAATERGAGLHEQPLCSCLLLAPRLTCSSPPGRAEVLHACGGHAATAAPSPASAALLTVHAWPAAGGPLTWGVEFLLVGPVGMEHLWDTWSLTRKGQTKPTKQ